MISFTRVSKQYGRQVLFVEASFQLNPGEKVGLVGPERGRQDHALSA
jgi:ATPase subunit of ABC transporter with duplicated ATPase domains